MSGGPRQYLRIHTTSYSAIHHWIHFLSGFYSDIPCRIRHGMRLSGQSGNTVPVFVPADPEEYLKPSETSRNYSTRKATPCLPLTRPRFKRSKSLIAVAAAALLALSACSSGGDSGSGTDSNGSGSTGTQAAGDPVSGQTLTWALEKSPVTLNPQQNSQDGFVFVLRNYADSYLYLNDKGEYEPWLAESYTQSDDRLDLLSSCAKG